MTHDYLRELARLDLFRGCRLTTLAYMDRLGTSLELPPGRTLCAEGAPADEFFVLVRGRVRVITSSSTEAILHPGGWFGEVAMLDGTQRHATVTSLTSVTVMVFDRRQFRSLLNAVPTVSARIQKSAMRFRSGTIPLAEPWYQLLSAGGSSLALGVS